ncbi:hypothetical protein HDZ31DRAFT_74831 [Schizophyllum fasciatum]
MTALTFVDKSLLNSKLCLNDGRVQFTTQSTKTSMGRSQETQILDGLSGAPIASIRWREKAFEINGRAFPIKQLRTKSSCLSQKSQWQWGSGTFEAKYKEGGWMITLEPSKDPIATLVPRESHLFHDDVPARVTLPATYHGGLGPDAIFFLVLLIYLQVTKESNEGKGEVAGAVGEVAGAVAAV